MVNNCGQIVNTKYFNEFGFCLSAKLFTKSNKYRTTIQPSIVSMGDIENEIASDYYSKNKQSMSNRIDGSWIKLGIGSISLFLSASVSLSVMISKR